MSIYSDSEGHDHTEHTFTLAETHSNDISMTIHFNTERTTLSRRGKQEIKATETVEKAKPVK